MRFLILFILLPFAGMSQTQFWNTTCANASFLSNTYPGDTMSSPAQPGGGCSGGSFKLYYYYRAVSNSVSLSVLSYSSSANTTFKAYGPFNSLSDGCAATWGLGNQVGSGTSATSQTYSHALTEGKFYILEITVASCLTDLRLTLNNRTYFSSDWETEGCTDCITGFRPKKGKYIVSGWTKVENAPGTSTTYSEPYIHIESDSMTDVDLYPSGDIIDGWQRIEGEVTTLKDSDFDITLVCENDHGGCYFDDIRVFPYDATMVTYVYDPVTLRLVAELDERNYAKFYEYDEDGKLIRVKKETERGIMTIQETRENNSKE